MQGGAILPDSIIVRLNSTVVVFQIFSKCANERICVTLSGWYGRAYFGYPKKKWGFGVYSWGCCLVSRVMWRVRLVCEEKWKDTTEKTSESICSSSSFPGKNPSSLSMSIFSLDVSLFCSVSKLSSLSDNNVLSWQESVATTEFVLLKVARINGAHWM